MNKGMFLILMLLFVSASTYAAKIDDDIASVKREIAAFEQMNSEKLDLLERAESKRWNLRYANNEEIKLLESRVQQLDTRYQSIANELKRIQDDRMLLTNVLDEERNSLNQTQAQLKGFVFQIAQAIEEVANKISSDFPYKIAERTARFTMVSNELQKDNADISLAIDNYFEDRISRYALTNTQMITTRAVLFGDGNERTVWNIRFGTIGMSDLDKNSSEFQSLLRTGTIEGARYSWRTGLPPQFREQLMLIVGQKDSTPLELPIDVLQNGKIGLVDALDSKPGFFTSFSTWFRNGGLIMYPLLIAAILALLISIERFITFTISHHRYSQSYKKLIPLIKKSDWSNASLYCKDSCTGLTRAIKEIVTHRGGSREQAEQQVQQILLSEVPALEKRLSLIATLAASAPLLGLLGTVSGMISLFKVITETGTNDARVLSGGISEALITTQAGLLIAIPILLLHGYLAERLDDILSHYNETVLEVFNIVFNGESIKRNES